MSVELVVPEDEDVTVSNVSQVWRGFKQDRAAVLALVFLGAISLVALLAPWIVPYDPVQLLAGPPFSGPSIEHWLGTDNLGRDVFSRIMYAARLSLAVSLGTVLVALTMAVPLGLVAGYVGGRIDNVFMRIMDGFMAFPALVLAIALVAVLGANLRNTMLAIAVVLIPTFARLVRGQTLAVKEENFIEASRSLGASQTRVIVRRVLPNVLSPLTVQVTIALGVVLLAEASLSFLGLGAQPPESSWGSMLRRAHDSFLEHPSQTIPPGMAIVLTVLAFNLVGDGLLGALRGIQGTTGAHAVRRGRPGTGLTPAARKEGVSSIVSEGQDLLMIDELTVEFATGVRPLTVVDDVSFSIAKGETLGLVGESGSGKTVTSLSIMRLLPPGLATIRAKALRFGERNLLDLGLEDMAALRGRDVAMIFQDPLAALNPVLTIGRQIAEVVRWHEHVPWAEARRRAAEALELVGIPASRAGAYPHELSGGMRQRAMIAMAIVCRPQLLIADEPTSALDVTIQAQILDLLRQLQREFGMSLLLVTHDFGVVADICDRVVVMYAGHTMESGPVRDIFSTPSHPYTAALLEAMPQGAPPGSLLPVIPGSVPRLDKLGSGCRFAGRCGYRIDLCEQDPVSMRRVGGRHHSRCIRQDGLELTGSRRG